MFKRLSFAFDLREYIPKTFVCLQEGYSRTHFFHDFFAGLGIGIISLPLVMAFAIASGVAPERGLFTAIVAGFLISLLGGSRVQIGGPTGAYVVLVYGVVDRHGYEGLAIATLLAGILIALMGLFRLGSLLKYIPFPVITGFTSGIAVLIFTSQMKDFFGLQLNSHPVEFFDKWKVYFQHIDTLNPWSVAVAFFTLGVILFFRRLYPRIPGVVIGVFLATLVVFLFNIPVETIESKFGQIPRMLPTPSLPNLSVEKVLLLFPDAITIALLGAVESLLSAVVADGMTGTRHRSNCELLAQGIANIGSVLFGGIPATGAIARTTANIKMNAKTPVSGMIHAITLLLLMLFFAPLAVMIPFPALAAILIFVAWNMSEMHHFMEIFRGPRSDRIVLVMTFFLTLVLDLAIAVQVGVVLSALLFLRRMRESTKLSISYLLAEQHTPELPELHDSSILFRADVPPEVVVFEIDGPLFFAVADRLNEALIHVDSTTKIFILRMHKIPMMDSTGVRALKQFHQRLEQKKILFFLSGARPVLQHLLKESGVTAVVGQEQIFPHITEALAYAKRYLETEQVQQRKASLEIAST